MDKIIKTILKSSPDLFISIAIGYALDTIKNPTSKNAQTIRKLAVPLAKALMEKFPEDFVK